MIASMTGFATGKGAHGAHSWSWELRAVNGRGQDIRVRVPDWITGLEQALRKEISAATARGNITVGLRLSRDEDASVVGVNRAQLDAVLAAMSEAEQAAMDAGISLAPSTVASVLSQRGVMELQAADDDPEPLLKALVPDFKSVLAAFLEMRKAEGAALAEVILGQLDEIERLVGAAVRAAEARKEDAAEALRAALARVMETVEFDEARLAQELALLAVKSDITEELDRLRAHIAAARALVTEGGALGRKLDFLAQEFNREANTLCSKSQHAALTETGLSLKAVIDQMREQIQNVE